MKTCRLLLEKGHRQTQSDQGLGHHESNVAAPDHDGLRAGRSQITKLEPVLEPVEGEKTADFLLWYEAGQSGVIASGEDQLFVADDSLVTFFQFYISEPSTAGHDLRNPGPGESANSPLFLQALRRELNQIGVVSDHLGYVIRQAADTVGDETARLQDQDVEFRIQPLGAAGRCHSSSISPDYDDSLGHPARNISRR